MQEVTLPFGVPFALVFFVLIVALLLRFAVPGLRSQRWLLWTIVGAIALLLLGSLLWTYLVDVPLSRLSNR